MTSYEQDIKELQRAVGGTWASYVGVSRETLVRLLAYLEETNESVGYYATKARAKDLTISSLEGQIRALKLSLKQERERHDAAEARATNVGKMELLFDDDLRQRIIEALS